VWPCLIHRLPFEVILAVPGGKGKSGTNSTEYRDKFPLGIVPSIEDSNAVMLSESPAILSYLAEKHNWNDIIPSDLSLRAKVNEYLSWHHGGIRSLAKAFFAPKVRPDIIQDAASVAAAEALAMRSLALVDSYFLGKGLFIAGMNQPSAADFLCYSEVAQLGPRFGNVVCFDEYPRLSAWINAMEKLPFHDEVFESVKVLGDLRDGHGDVPVLKRLAPATKAGMLAIQSAQASLEARTQ
jgi:glutathione S-transferase